MILDTLSRWVHDVTMTTYGFIGLGSMGAPMAVRLAAGCAERGDQLLVWNRTSGRDAAVLAAGAEASREPAALVAASDVVVVMLPDLRQLIELTDGPAGLLSKVRTPTVLVVCSSISPQGSRDYAAHAAELTDGLVQVVDAPVSGGPEGASTGHPPSWLAAVSQPLPRRGQPLPGWVPPSGTSAGLDRDHWQRPATRWSLRPR